MKLRIKVIPKSSRNGIAGWMGDTLKVQVTAPPERGKANAAVQKVLADALGVPRKCIRLVTGLTSTRKVLEIDGPSESEVRSHLAGRDA